MNTTTTTTSLATLAAIASHSAAAVVQISLDDVFLTSTVNQLTADFTGDGNDDFAIANVSQVFNPPTSSSTFYTTVSGAPFTYFNPGSQGYFRAGLSINGSTAFARATVTSFGGSAYSDSSIAGSTGVGDGITVLLPISFMDINYGGDINAWLEVAATNFDPRIDIRRIIWDDENLTERPAGISPFDAAYPTATQIPETGSLALLALGAGGLAARRRRAA